VAQQRAIRSVQQLYDAIAIRDYERARGFFRSEAADQFDPSYLEQYEQVAIQDLRVTGQSGTTIQLEGVVSWVRPDGSRYLESRSFSVDAASEPAQVTASAFQRVLP
jgi:serine/threonine-protein kinase